MKPRVSVIMSVYNGEQYLDEAITSILKQTYREFEFIIIDDGSKDRSAQIVKEYAKKDKRIRFSPNGKNLGLIASLNKGLQLSKGEYIARMDADDVALPQRLAKQVKFLDTHPAIAIVGTWATIISPEGRTLGEITYETAPEGIRRRMVERNQFIHPSVMMRRSAQRQTGEYDPAFRSCEDYEFFARLIAKHDGANIPQKLMRYRWDLQSSVSFTTTKLQERNSLRTRWRMVTRYGWPKRDLLRIIRPACSYLIPDMIKKMLLRRVIRRRLSSQ